MTGRSRSALLALAALYSSVAAQAVASAAPPANSVISNPAVASNSTGLVAGLVFLLALVLVAAWLVKRSGGMQTWRAGASIKVVAALSLGPRERVVLIEAGGQQWLLGVAAGSITTLHHFEQPLITASGNAEDFSHKLRQFLPQGLGK